MMGAVTPEMCRVVLQWINICILLHLLDILFTFSRIYFVVFRWFSRFRQYRRQLGAVAGLDCVIKAGNHGRLPFPGCVAVCSSVYAGTKYKLSDNVSLSSCIYVVLSFVTSIYSKTTEAEFLLGIFNKPFLEMLYVSWLLRVLNL